MFTTTPVLTAVYAHPENGHAPARNLEIGKEYVMTNVSMGRYFTDIELADINGVFNSVQFDFFEGGKPVDIYRSARYNPYMR